MKSLLLASLTLVLCASSVSAQQTGSFDASVVFKGETRVVSMYVPTTYDSTSEYSLLVGLHGAGHNSKAYRDALIAQAGWPSLFSNTIMLFPDGGNDQARDFYAPKGDEEFITACIQSVMSRYSIDASDVILQGFSLGGRSALKYGLTYPEKFKGLLLNTPAVQGPLDIIGVPSIDYGYKFENASKVPVYISVGSEDLSYLGPIRSMARTLMMNSCYTKLLQVSGMGHTIPPNSVTIEAKNHIGNGFAQGLDASIFYVEMPARVCEGTMDIVCHVQNVASNEITKMAFTALGTTKQWTGKLSPGQHMEYVLPVPVSLNGSKSVEVKISDLNTADRNTSNNTAYSQPMFSTGPGTDQNAESFDTDSPTWTIIDSDHYFSWYRDSDVKRSGYASLAAFNSILMYYTQGLREEIISPYLNIKQMTNPTISFDYAYNYHVYTADVLGVNAIFADTLEVSVSTDCGETYRSIYRKAGEALTTTSAPIKNPMSINDCFFFPNSREWRYEVLDLAQFANSENALVKMSYISGRGGSINIDNIKVGSDVVGVDADDIANPSFTMYPNPASTIVNLASPVGQYGRIVVYDNTGRVVLLPLQQDATGTTTALDITGVDSGVYTVEVATNNGVRRQRLVVRR